MPLSIKGFTKHFEEFKSTGQEPQLIILGYKTFAKLMKDEKFVDQTSKDLNDPLVRYYNNIKIKIVPEKHHLEIK